MRYQGWDEILMITLIFSKKLEVSKLMKNTVKKLSGATRFSETSSYSKPKLSDVTFKNVAHISIYTVFYKICLTGL